VVGAGSPPFILRIGLSDPHRHLGLDRHRLGKASSWGAIDDAAAGAWAVPGVTDVIDKLSVDTL
jgi:hypothetical protein